jgi:hypothetical protein
MIPALKRIKMSDTILFTFISIINYKVWRTWELAQKGGGG